MDFVAGKVVEKIRNFLSNFTNSNIFVKINFTFDVETPFSVALVALNAPNFAKSPRHVADAEIAGSATIWMAHVPPRRRKRQTSGTAIMPTFWLCSWTKRKNLESPKNRRFCCMPHYHVLEIVNYSCKFSSILLLTKLYYALSIIFVGYYRDSLLTLGFARALDRSFVAGHELASWSK